MSDPKRTNGDSANVALMKAMGSKSGEYDPMPPAQYQSFLSAHRSEDLRVWAAILERTIGRADDGTRSAYCRESMGHDTKPKHLAAALDMLPSQVSEALGRLEAENLIRRHEGRIYLRADVPAPDLTRKKQKGEEMEKFLYTVKVSEEEARYLSRLETADPERFRAVAVRLLAVEAWNDKLQADAMAWAREHGTDARNQVLTESGYTKHNQRGAKRIRPASTSDSFKVPVSLETFTVHKEVEISKKVQQFTVQDRKLIPYVEQSKSVQNPHPYGPESRVQSSASSPNEDMDAKAKTSKAELKREQANAEVKNEIKIEIRTRLQRAKLTALGAVQMDAGTLNTLAADMARLKTAGEVREVLDVLEERARELRTGARVADGWGYLVKTVRGEVEKRLPADLKSQIKTTAAGKTMR